MSTQQWAPPIAAHRLLGDGTSTALLRPPGAPDGIRVVSAAPGVAYVVSDEAAYVSGASLVIDGALMTEVSDA